MIQKIEKVAKVIYVTRLDTGVTAQFEWDDDLGNYGSSTTQLFSDDDVGNTIELEFVLE